MYKIIYVDEYMDDIDDFLDYIDEKDTGNLFDVKYLLPEPEVDKMIENIFDEKPDAIVMDFFLNEMKTEIEHNVPYNGVVLAERILELKKHFPCFVMTSFDNDAIKVSKDVNLIYIKDILHGSESRTEAKSTFVDKIEEQIKHYRQEIENAQSELSELIDKSLEGALTAQEENRIIMLDSFIEQSTNMPSEIPPQLKEKTNLNKLHHMIDSTDKLLEQLGVDLDDDLIEKLQALKNDNENSN